MPPKVKKPDPIPLVDGDSERSTRRKRADMGAQLTGWIELSRAEFQGLRDKWKEVWEYLRNQEMDDADSSPNQDSDNIPAPVPYISPRIDTLCSMVNGVVLGQDPPMVADTGLEDPEISDVLERIIALAWEEGGFPTSVAENAVHCSVTNKAIWRVGFNVKAKGFDGGPKGGKSRFDSPYEWAGPTIDAIAPDDFVIAPACPRLQDATMVGRRFYMLAVEVRERIILGDYYDVKMQDSDASAEAEEEVLAMGDSPETADDMGGVEDSLTVPGIFDGVEDLRQIELYEVYVKLAPAKGSLRKTYKAVVAPGYQALLKFELWPFPRFPFVAGRFKWDPSAKSFWEGRSVGRDLLPLSSRFNAQHKLFMNGSMVSALPNFFTAQPMGDKNTYLSEGGGSIVEVDDTGMPLTGWQPQTDFQGEAILNDIQNMERYGDIVSRTSNNALGVSESKEVTATQTQAIQQGASAGINDYIRWFTEPFAEMAAITMDFLSDPRYWRIWAPLWGFPDTARDTIQIRTRWKVAGQTISDNPQTRMGMAQTLIGASAKNPALGFDQYKLGTTLAAATNLKGWETLQIPRQEYEAMQQQMQQAAQQQGGADDGPDQGPPGAPANPNTHGKGPHQPGFNPKNSGMAIPGGLATSPQGANPAQDLPGTPAANAGRAQ